MFISLGSWIPTLAQSAPTPGHLCPHSFSCLPGGTVSRNSLICFGVHGREKDVGLAKAGACLQQVPKMTKQLGFSPLHYPASRMGEAAVSLGLAQLPIHLIFSLLALCCDSCFLLGIVRFQFFQSVAGSPQD